MAVCPNSGAGPLYDHLCDFGQDAVGLWYWVGFSTNNCPQLVKVCRGENVLLRKSSVRGLHEPV